MVLAPAATLCFQSSLKILSLSSRKGSSKTQLPVLYIEGQQAQWDGVQRTLKAQTCYQDVDDILDPAYVPQRKEDIALFDEKQKYMYSVLERILQTDEEKVIVSSHNGNRNTQAIYTEFLAVITSSTEALMYSGTLLSYLTTAKIKDGNWKGTSKTFVLN